LLRIAARRLHSWFVTISPENLHGFCSWRVSIDRIRHVLTVLVRMCGAVRLIQQAREQRRQHGAQG
jgi:hypothetical protein